jgi:peptidoglycan/xylan/chitin deacetylase (PgdA/CDA1 family)
MLRPHLVKFLAGFALLLAMSAGAAASALVEPRLTIAPGSHYGPRVALTLDACSGAADERILQVLIAHRIPATVFATARWLARNPRAVAEINAHPDLLEVENHGARHLAAIDRPMVVFGVAAAGSPAGVTAEVEGGAAAVAAATGRQPRWYRGAAAKYTASAITLIARLGFRIAGYSIAADGGARLSASATARNIARARDGDVILAHVNQPTRAAGAGVVAGILALQARGIRFVRLEDAANPAAPAPLTH